MNLCVPEVLAFISLSGQAFCRQTHSICACAGLIDMKEVKLYDLLDLVITSNFDVGSIPNCDLELSARHSADRRKRV
jgi:hypothetical protein